VLLLGGLARLRVSHKHIVVVGPRARRKPIGKQEPLTCSNVLNKTVANVSLLKL
jgi:hypothetical protein